MFLSNFRLNTLPLGSNKCIFCESEFGTLPENTNFGIKVSAVKSLLESDKVTFVEGSGKELAKVALGKLANDGTVFISCWMNTAQIEKMKKKKAMFTEIK